MEPWEPSEPAEGADVARPRPDVTRGPTRPLSDRAARLAARSTLTDREARFRERFATVQRAERRRARRERLLERATWLVVVAGLTAAGGWLAGLVDVPTGAGIAGGVAAAAVVLAGRAWLARYAASRGARAWDWQRRRYVAHGDPSRHVQARDQAERPGGARGTPRGTPWGTRRGGRRHR